MTREQAEARLHEMVRNAGLDIREYSQVDIERMIEIIMASKPIPANH
jgi:hypothetical protein